MWVFAKGYGGARLDFRCRVTAYEGLLFAALLKKSHCRLFQRNNRQSLAPRFTYRELRN